MADVILTLKIMLTSPDVDPGSVGESVKGEIEAYGGRVGKVEVEPVAFGLKALKISFIMDESKGGSDPLEEKIKELEGVKSVEVIGVTRALG